MDAAFNLIIIYSIYCLTKFPPLLLVGRSSWNWRDSSISFRALDLVHYNGCEQSMYGLLAVFPQRRGFVRTCPFLCSNYIPSTQNVFRLTGHHARSLYSSHKLLWKWPMSIAIFFKKPFLISEGNLIVVDNGKLYCHGHYQEICLASPCGFQHPYRSFHLFCKMLDLYFHPEVADV